METKCLFIFINNSTNYCTILILQLHTITYDLLLQVSTLIRHLQVALYAWLKLHTLQGTCVKISRRNVFSFNKHINFLVGLHCLEKHSASEI